MEEFMRRLCMAARGLCCAVSDKTNPTATACGAIDLVRQAALQPGRPPQERGSPVTWLGTDGALSMCFPSVAIALKDGVVAQTHFGDFPVPRITDMPQVAVPIVPSAEPPTAMGEPGLLPLAPAFANAVARFTGKTPQELPFKFG